MNEARPLNPSNYEEIPPFPERSKPDVDFIVNAIIETPRGIRHKFAFEPKLGLFRLTTTIEEGLQWPYDYGFIPGTLADDGDPLDILYLNDEPTFTGCFVQARLLGIIRLEKNGTRNDRIISCAQQVEGIVQSTDAYTKMSDVPKEMLRSLERFLVEYSEGAGNKVVCTGVDGRKKALDQIHRCIDAFKAKRR